MPDSFDDARQADLYFAPYPPIERLATIGDRRTSATVAADGTVSWMCLPKQGSLIDDLGFAGAPLINR